MRKKIISMILILAMCFNTYMVALAEDDDIQYETTATKLKSTGAIVYQNGTDSVVIDSNDLYMLANEFDSFKVALYRQMAEMNTYLTTKDEGIALITSQDINVVHSTPSDIVSPLSVNFDTLIEGLAASQSIPHTPLEYGYTEGTNLYKTTEGLLTTEASEGTEMIEIEAATADNLSAGAAAWVNGELILGNGNDVEKAYKQAYNQGAKDTNLIVSGLYLNLSVSEKEIGSSTSTNAQIPVSNLDRVSFTVNKGGYGQLIIELIDNEGKSTNFRAWNKHNPAINESITIILNKKYKAIRFIGNPDGGGISIITISNFRVG